MICFTKFPRSMRIRATWLVVIFLVLQISYANDLSHAAVLKRAETITGNYLAGAIVLEGEIVPGDAERLLAALLYENHILKDQHIDEIYLRSKGGDVDEAIRIGQIVRRLRLRTNVPVYGGDGEPSDIVYAADKNNVICASACFLIYAAGVDRFGNYLALHRPYVQHVDASRMNDAQYEESEKEVISKVRAYLDYMEIDKFWIGKMLSTNSQNAYVIPWELADDKNYHLMGIVPSIEEVLLSKCDEFNTDCNKRALNEIRKAALDREVNTLIAKHCNGQKEIDTSKAPSQSVDGVELGKAKHSACERDFWGNMSVLANVAPPDKPDLSLFIAGKEKEDRMLAKALQSATQGDIQAQFEAGRMYANKGNIEEAVAWWKKAAERGNTDAELSIGLLLENETNKASEAISWDKRAANEGSQLAKLVLGNKYMSGEGVPQDYVQAYMWFTLCGSKGAQDNLADITPHMTPAQITQARQLARDWKLSK